MILEDNYLKPTCTYINVQMYKRACINVHVHVLYMYNVLRIITYMCMIVLNIHVPVFLLISIPPSSTIPLHPAIVDVPPAEGYLSFLNVLHPLGQLPI